MTEQITLFLFEQNTTWVQRLWNQMDAPIRQQIIEILAEMGKEAVAVQSNASTIEEANDES